LHRRDLNQVHFHELSGKTPLIDIVGTTTALELLGIERSTPAPSRPEPGWCAACTVISPIRRPRSWTCSPARRCGDEIVNVELTTPTGAAILATLALDFGPMPAMIVEATGYGAGTKEIGRTAELHTGRLRATRRVARAGRRRIRRAQPLVLLEANVDDATGEQLSDALNALFDAGAADAWIAPVLMKKGRPGHIVSVLGDVALVDALRQVLIDEAGTFGVRAHLVDRYASTRHATSVEVDGHNVGIKVSPGRAKVEHDDAARVARELKRARARGTRTRPNTRGVCASYTKAKTPNRS